MTTRSIKASAPGPPHPRLGDIFGAAVAGAANGFAIVGAPGDDEVTGTVFVFDSGTGDLELTLGNPEPADGGGAGDSFGAAVDARFNGDILVGAPGEDGGEDSGAAYLFSHSAGELLQSYANPELGVDSFGSHVGVVPASDYVLVGATRQAYLLDRDSGDHLSTFNPWVFGDHHGLPVGSCDSGLFVGGGNAFTGVAYLFPRPGVPEMSVHGNYIAIVDGDMTPSVGELTDFGDVNLINGGTVTHTFFILNLGDTALHLTGNPRVSISGPAAADFTVTLQPPASVAADRGIATFKVRFDPSRFGWRIATISIDNDDANEGPYNFNIRGRGL